MCDQMTADKVYKGGSSEGRPVVTERILEVMADKWRTVSEDESDVLMNCC